MQDTDKEKVNLKQKHEEVKNVESKEIVADDEKKVCFEFWFYINMTVVYIIYNSTSNYTTRVVLKFEIFSLMIKDYPCGFTYKPE